MSGGRERWELINSFPPTGLIQEVEIYAHIDIHIGRVLWFMRITERGTLEFLSWRLLIPKLVVSEHFGYCGKS
jgi:hypothetical protein